MGAKLKFFETASFKDQQREWYDTLKKDGFKDKEALVEGELYLLKPGCYPFTRKNGLLRGLNQAEYFLRLAHLVEAELWINRRDELIMSLRAEGCKICEIEAQLNQRKLGCHRQTIRFVIRKFEHKWGLRKWKKEQMTSWRPTR